MKKFLSFGFFILLFFSSARADDCFFLASFDPLLQRVTLRCLDLGTDFCFTSTIDVEVEPGDVRLVVTAVNATDILIDNLTDPSLVPFYDPDNGTVVIPGLVIGPEYFRVVLRPVFMGNYIILDLLSIIPIPSVDPVCLPSNDTGDGTSSSGENVISMRLTNPDGLITCYELKGSAEFISVAENSLPIYVVEGTAEVERFPEPCPPGYLIGCYTIDEDGNWYAQYKYEHPLSDYLYPLVCPEENGYHYIFP